MTLLERESQLGSLLQYADEARTRAGRLVLVSGEAGVGKTSLVEELAAPVARRHVGLGCLRRAVHAPTAGAAARHRPRDRREPAGRGAAAPRRATRSSTPCCSAPRPSRTSPCWSSRTSTGPTTRPSTCSASSAVGSATCPVLLLVTFRDDALAPDRPAPGRPRRARRTAFHPPHRPPAAHPGRRPSPGRGHVVLPRRAVRAHRRQPVLRRRGPERAAARGCRRPPGTPCSPVPPGSATGAARPWTWPPSTPGGWTPS